MHDCVIKIDAQMVANEIADSLAQTRPEFLKGDHAIVVLTKTQPSGLSGGQNFHSSAKELKTPETVSRSGV
jgi:hypothetical protein